MRILRIEIAAFGKWRQKTFDFISGNQLIYGQRFTNLFRLYYLASLQKERRKKTIRRKMGLPMVGKFG